MKEACPVSFCGKDVGKVEVCREGLYYRFSCRCQMVGDGLYRLDVTCGTNRRDLGIMLTEGTGFCLTTRVPAKTLGEGEMLFRLLPQKGRPREAYTPIYPEEPNRYLERMKAAFTAKQTSQSYERLL